MLSKLFTFHWDLVNTLYLISKAILKVRKKIELFVSKYFH